MVDNKHGPGYVYLLDRLDGWFRIGRTANPEQRFKQWRWLAKNNGYSLSPLLLVQVENQNSAERMLHAIFESKQTEERHRGMGPRHEWFKLTTADLFTFKQWADIIGIRTFDLCGCWILPEEIANYAIT